MGWWFYALLSAGFAALTAVLAKVGVEGIPSNLATALRTVVILLFAWAMVLVRGEQQALPALSRRTLIFLALSGLATGCSWLAYFRALQLGPISKVAPVDKFSVVLTVGLGALLFGEALTLKLIAGVIMIACGTLLTLR